MTFNRPVFCGTSNVCNVILRKGVFVGLIE